MVHTVAIPDSELVSFSSFTLTAGSRTELFEVAPVEQLCGATRAVLKLLATQQALRATT